MPQRFHRVQQATNTCVAACMAMVHARYGNPRDENAICVDWGPPARQGYSYTTISRQIAQELQHLRLRKNETEDWLFALEHIEAGYWALVFVCPGPMMEWSQNASVSAQHLPHGQLRSDRPRDHHAVLITARDAQEGTLDLLDPWIATPLMPLRVDEYTFVNKLIAMDAYLLFPPPVHHDPLG